MNKIKEKIRRAFEENDADALMKEVKELEDEYDFKACEPIHIHYFIDANKFRMASGPQSVYKRCKPCSLIKNSLGCWFAKLASKSNYEYVPHPIFVNKYPNSHGLQVPVFTSLKEARFANFVMQNVILPHITQEEGMKAIEMYF